jgi:hypothetical protein
MKQLVRLLFGIGLICAFVWPRYFFINLGGRGVNAFTIFTLLLLTVSTLLFLAVPRVQGRTLVTLGASVVALVSLFIYFTWRLLADFSGVDRGASLGLTVQSIVFGAGWLWIVAVLLTDERLHRAFPALLTTSGLIATLGGILEYQFQTPFLDLLGLSSISTMDTQTLSAINAASSEAGQFRIKGVFAHPIFYGQVMALMAPVAFHMIRFGRSAGKISGVLLLMSIVLGIVLSQSRSPLVVLVVTSVAYLGLFAFDIRTPARILFFAAMMFGGTLIMPAAVNALLNTTAGADPREARSSFARSLQYQRMTDALTDRAAFGYGTGEAPNYAGIMGRNEVMTVDSTLIAEAVEGGYVRLGLFLTMLACFFLQGSMVVLSLRDGALRSGAAMMTSWFPGIFTGVTIIAGEPLMAFVFIALGYVVATQGLHMAARRRARSHGKVPAAS